MTVKALVYYYEQLTAYPQQDEILADNRSYAQIAQSLRDGTFSPKLHSEAVVFSQKPLYENSDTYYQNARLLQYDRIKIKQTINGRDEYHPSLIKLDGMVFSWNHPVFEDYT